MRTARLFGFCGLLLTSSVSAGSLGLLGALVMGCEDPGVGDEGVNLGVPPAAGKDRRIREIADPESPLKAPASTSVAVSGALVTAVDTYDETGAGATGTIYVQDLGSRDPYAGISLFAPSFIPGNLRVGAGDVLDLRGEYQENQGIGTTVTFAPGAVLPQLGRPIATFRFDAHDPEPVDIDVTELADYAKGRKWMSMLVRVRNITLTDDLFVADSGRANVPLTPSAGGATKCEDPFPKPPTLVNELAPIQTMTTLKQGAVIKSLTGVVTYFCNFHIAPRTTADIVL